MPVIRTKQNKALWHRAKYSLITLNSFCWVKGHSIRIEFQPSDVTDNARYILI